jgi:hypothetical protein
MDAKAYLLAGSPTLELVVVREAVSRKFAARNLPSVDVTTS